VAETVSLKSLAQRVLQRDSVRDSVRDKVSHGGETARGAVGQYQELNSAPVPAVSLVPGVPSVPPVSDVSPTTMAYRAASVGPDGTVCKVTIVELPQAQRYRKTFALLQTKCPALVPPNRWKACVEDGKRFLAKWGEQAEALGWTSADLFGLHSPPDNPHPSYNRLSRYDCTGLCWLLQGRRVTALTEATAAIENPTGAITVYRKHNKPALGPLGDSLDDFK
jgi:hypothetical protein